MNTLCQILLLSAIGALLLAEQNGDQTLALAFFMPHAMAGNAPAPTSASLSLPADTIVRTNPRDQGILSLQAEDLAAALVGNREYTKSLAGGQFGEAAIAFITAYRLVFKLIDPSHELSIKIVDKDDIGYKHIRLEQVFSGLPVLGGELIVHFDKGNHLYLVNGRYVPTPAGMNVQPTINSKDAQAVIAKALPNLEANRDGCKTRLVIFDDPANKPHLAYQIIVSPSVAEGWEFIVDAETGAILRQLSTVFH
jgi:hypothetical protein